MPDDTIYRLTFETVSTSELWRYCNANPVFYKNTTQTVPNSQIPDEHWRPVERIDTNPWNQYHTLKRWADADEQFVRNVRLERGTCGEPIIAWEPVDADIPADRLAAIRDRKPLHDALEAGPGTDGGDQA